MQWNENALILGTRRHGERSVILEVMTREHGRHLGLVRSGRTRSMQPSLQVGNKVSVSWRARLEDHLGVFTVEPVELRAAQLMETAVGLHGVQLLATLLRFLPERAPHPGLAEGAEIVIENLDQPMMGAVLLIRFELALLDELGFGLDLTTCAATGSRDDLVYVSPKSGRAVSRKAGQPYHNKLLTLPGFLLPDRAEIDVSTIDNHALKAAFALTEFFLSRHIFEPRGLTPPLSREVVVRETMKICS